MKKITLIFFLSLLSFCGYAQFPEGFETGWTLAPTGTTATGWFTIQNGMGLNITWAQGAANSTIQQPAYTGERAAFLQREIGAAGGPEDYLVTPAFTVPSDPELRFFSRLTQAGVQGSTYKIFILNLTATPTADLNSPASYTQLQTWTELEINPEQLMYIEKVIPIPAAYVGAQVRIAFMMKGGSTNSDRWLIDDINVVKKCVPPVTLAATNVGLHSADLSWANPSGATSWDIELIGGNDAPSGTPTHSYSGALPFTVSAGILVEDTCYKYYVRSNCDTNGKSIWVGPFFFCTKGLGDNCTAPLVVAALPYTDTDTTNNFADEYEGEPGTGCTTNTGENYLSGNDVVYKYTAAFTGEINIDLSNTDPYAGVFVYASCADIGVQCLAGGTAGDQANNISLDEFAVTTGEDYYIVISSNAAVTDYTLTIQAVACDEPVGAPVTNIGSTWVELSWSNPTGATSWGVIVQPKGTGVPQGTGETATINTNYVWDELQPSTVYEYWVRANCGNGTFSAWAGPYYFNTKGCEAADQCNFTFHMWSAWGSWSDHTMSVKQNGITIATLTGPGDDGVPIDVSVPLCNNMPVQLFWDEIGTSWAAANVGISVKNSFGQEIYEKALGQGVQNTTLYEVVIDCEKPYCMPVKGLTATNATQTTVDLGWDGAATGQWEYYIVEAGEPAPTADTVGTSTTTNPTIGAGPLAASTNYDYYVRAHCEDASTTVSEWSKPSAFGSSVCDSTNKCDYEFVMKSEGQPGGWNEASMTIRQNGTNVAVIGPTFTVGESQSIIVPLCTGIPFEVLWNNGGGSPNQVGLSIINSFNQEIFNLPFNTPTTGIVIYTDNVDCLHPKCMAPVDLTAANGTMTSIDLGWSGTATGNWEYYIVEPGQPAPTDDTSGVSTTTNPTIAVPLPQPNTNYEYYVRAICTGASTPTSKWTGPYLMHSEACNPEDKCVFYFELTSKRGWAYEGNTITVSQGGVVVAVLGSGFDMADNPYTHMVEVSLCPDMEIEIVWNEEGEQPNDKGLHVYTPHMEDVYIKPFGEGTQGDVLYTGFVSCVAPTCLKPQQLTVSDIGLTSATFDWTEMGNADSWEIWVLTLGSPAPTTSGTIVTSHPYTFENLTPGTPYVFYVRANCGDVDGYSTWSGPFKFITLIANDDCDAAVTVPVNSGIECLVSVGGTLTGSVWSGVISECAVGEIDNDVWFEFTAVEDEHIVSVRNQLGVKANIGIYEGDNCGNLTHITCVSYLNNNGTISVAVPNLMPGNKYLIMVYTEWLEPEASISFDVCVSTPKSVIVDDMVPVEDIVLNTLIQSSCVNVQNITWKTGTEIGINGIGRFEKGLSAFQLEEGVVLSTGKASDTPGPYLNGSGEGGWDGDDQLEDYMNNLDLDPGSYGDATVLEFDFTPLSTKIKFPFIFASMEYGIYQCSFSDAFAFFLTTDDGTGTPVTVNLAIVPNTDAPVSTASIRNTEFNPGCESVNVTYFDKYYGHFAGGNLTTDPLFAPLNFEGNTVKMFAEAVVVPNQVYHIKLVIAEKFAGNGDSAVFIGKFETTNVNLGLDLTFENGGALCANITHTIESGADPNEYTFTWYKDGELIPGEIAPNLEVSETGTYKVIANFGGTCTTEDSVKIEFYPDIEKATGDPLQLTVCDADGFGTFNLSDNTAIIVGEHPADYTISYHLSNEDAWANLGALPLTNYNNVTQYLQEIHVRIVNKGGCVAVKTFNLVIRDFTPLFKVNDDFTICEGTTATISVTPVSPANYDPAVATYTWTKDGESFQGTTASITVSVAGVYEVIVNNLGCPGTAAVKITITSIPVADAPVNINACISYTLPVLSSNNNYYTGPEGTGQILNEGDIITNTQTIYVFAQSATTPKCTAQNSFIVTIIPTAIITTAQGCEDGNYVLEVLFDPKGTLNAGNVTVAWTNKAGTVIGTNAKVIVESTGIYKVTIAPIGDEECISTTEVNVESVSCNIPRGISPNSDGMNDEFDLSGFGVRELKIFNRYGQEVYSKSNYTKEWHGQGGNGNELPTGTYYYMIDTSNSKTITGWVHINREE
ncbi:choice-of-anchor L domain-containing protein [Flavobacterium cerinum]|uniref:T9SS type B sorting domain-containing protein n=1 Tax=Flavobacterium cerinum TaxID=2502784 RepID=A0A444GL03_9FLAO|nr:choice-of-anchor L domain-containing protein [Flavobacterium cerinum]RWW91642.1 T9SS type B sorting domain-containing protein [Flavobacterium cerinum]